MKRSAVFLFYILSVLLCTQSETMCAEKIIYASESPEITGKLKKHVKIRLTLKTMSNFDLFQLKINQSVPLDFVLDSGFEPILLSEQNTSDSINLNFVTSRVLRGLGTSEDLRVFFSTQNSIYLSDVQMTDMEVFLVSNNDFNLSSKVGTRVNGVIGWDIFNNFVVEYKREQKVLYLHNPDTFRYRPKKKDSIIPLLIYNTKPYIECLLTFHDGSEKKVLLMLDTGLTDALWLFSNNPSNMGFRDLSNPVFLGRGLNGEVFGFPGKIQSIKVGNYSLNEPLVSVLDSLSSPEPQLVEDKFRAGSIGNEIMTRFDMILDFPGKRLIIRPGKRFKESFKQNMSGLEVFQPIRNLPYYTISHVEEGSPADQAGIIEGDEIASINGLAASTYTLDAIMGIFRTKPGSRVSIQVRRNKKLISAFFKLQETAKPLRLL